jgi:hypothetical protein
LIDRGPVLTSKGIKQAFQTVSNNCILLDSSSFHRMLPYKCAPISLLFAAF